MFSCDGLKRAFTDNFTLERFLLETNVLSNINGIKQEIKMYVNLITLYRSLQKRS